MKLAPLAGQPTVWVRLWCWVLQMASSLQVSLVTVGLIWQLAGQVHCGPEDWLGDQCDLCGQEISSLECRFKRTLLVTLADLELRL